MYRGIGWGPKPICGYCGGPHPTGQCPMPYMPPSMPYMPPSMPAMPPSGGMMPGMAEHMARVEKMLADIKQCCDQTSAMVKEIYMKTAKG